MSHPTLLLFDIDGTILTGGGVGMRAMAGVAERLFGVGFRWDGVDAAGHLDPLIFKEAAELNGVTGEGHHARFHEAYIEALAAEVEKVRGLGQVKAIAGIHEALEMLRERREKKGDLVLGLLTGNYARAVPIKLNAVGVDVGQFTVTAFGDEGASRQELVRVAMRKFERDMGRGVEARRVVIIGDTPRDVECARVNGCVAYGVATGRFSVGELKAAGADVAVENLVDLRPLLGILEGD
jgi:phosphoglycolate phosphatase